MSVALDGSEVHVKEFDAVAAVPVSYYACGRGRVHRNFNPFDIWDTSISSAKRRARGSGLCEVPPEYAVQLSQRVLHLYESCPALQERCSRCGFAQIIFNADRAVLE